MCKPSTRWIYGDPGFRGLLRTRGIEDLASLSSPSLGAYVTGHRSSWVRRLADEADVYYIKTYDYPTWKSRYRGVGRNTFLAISRPRREQRALTWLAENGFEAPRVRAVVESRVLGIGVGGTLLDGFLVRGVLVTDAWPGVPLSTLLPELDPNGQVAVLESLREFVSRLHASGFRDGNLDLRNILAREHDGTGWRFAKIDSPRFRLVRGRSQDDALASRDWQRLERDLATIGLALPGSTTDRAT